MLSRPDGEDSAGGFSGRHDHVLRPCGAMHEVPLAQWPLFALDDEQALAGEHEKVFLVGFPVVHRHRLTRPEHGDPDPDLREVRLALEAHTVAAPLAVAPSRLPCVEDEPSLPGGHEPCLGRSERCFRNHARMLGGVGVERDGRQDPEPRVQGRARATLDEVTEDWIEGVRSLLEAPSPAVLTTYRRDGSASVSPVWFRWADEAFEVVIAKGDLKLRHLARDPRCALVIFEAVRPFRGVEVRGVAKLVDCDVTDLRAAIAGRYLGANDGAQFAADRKSKPGILLRLVADSPRIWNLSRILPAGTQ